MLPRTSIEESTLSEVEASFNISNASSLPASIHLTQSDDDVYVMGSLQNHFLKTLYISWHDYS